jgi:hypothetical protein
MLENDLAATIGIMPITHSSSVRGEERKRGKKKRRKKKKKTNCRIRTEGRGDLPGMTARESHIAPTQYCCLWS